ncbi:MAG: Na+/H+ antiporter NhaC family protein [Oscillospiraceae bacterium]
MGKKIETPKANGLALIPFVVFIALYLGAGIVCQQLGMDMAFYQFPAPVAIVAGVIVAFIIFKGTIDENFSDFAKGCGEENIVIMLTIYLLAGAFASVAKAMGGVDATVNLGLSLIPAQFITAGLFVISSFLAVATGTSMGTIGAIAPIAIGVATKAGLNMPLVLAAVIGGAMFGDNLSIISDTTIAATRTQGCEMRDKFRVNLMIAAPAAILTFVLLLIFGRPETVVPLEALSYDFIKVIPYIIVLVLAVVGVNVFLVLGSGVVVAGIIGIFYGQLNILTFAQSIYGGFTGMTEVFLLSMITGGLAYMVTKNGGLQWLLDKIQGLIKGEKSAELGIAALTAAADMATANNTVAIIVVGPIAKSISTQYKVDPRRTASILDITSCIFQGAIPYGAQLLLAGTLARDAGFVVGPMDLIPLLWYQGLLAVFMILSVYIPYADGVIKKTPWDWDKKAKEEVEA